MGYWGAGPYENDDGSDIKCVWEDFVLSDGKIWEKEKIIRFFERVYFNGVFPIASEGKSDEIIALCCLFSDHNIALPERLACSLADSIIFELSRERISEWGDLKEKRRNSLKKIAQQFSIEISASKPGKRESRYSEEISSLRTWFDNIDKVNSLLSHMSVKIIDWVEGNRPAFLEMLEAQTWRFFDEDDENNSCELARLRFAAAVWLVFFNLKYSPEEINKAVYHALGES